MPSTTEMLDEIAMEIAVEMELRPFAEASDKLHSGYDDGIAAGDHPFSHVFVRDLRRARTALSGE